MPNAKKLRTLLVLLSISLWWGATGPARLYGQKKQAPLVVSYSALVASQSYLWIAKEAGYFERHGLDVKMVFISSGAHNVAALLAGDVDIGIIGGMGVMRAKLGGADLYLIGGTKNQYAGSIVAQPQIKTPAELKGKRIAITRRGSNPEFMAKAALQRFGMNPDRGVKIKTRTRGWDISRKMIYREHGSDFTDGNIRIMLKILNERHPIFNSLHGESASPISRQVRLA
ncbi:MAG TPA: ABC transporter substrate-binding protein [Candidatus Binatia bacterium]|nr:ABC transporter substrate-binding protein [Candidatus Binatia bacterium]